MDTAELPEYTERLAARNPMQSLGDEMWVSFTDGNLRILYAYADLGPRRTNEKMAQCPIQSRRLKLLHSQEGLTNQCTRSGVRTIARLARLMMQFFPHQLPNDKLPETILQVQLYMLNISLLWQCLGRDTFDAYQYNFALMTERL